MFFLKFSLETVGIQLEVEVYYVVWKPNQLSSILVDFEKAIYTYKANLLERIDGLGSNTA